MKKVFRSAFSHEVDCVVDDKETWNLCGPTAAYMAKSRKRNRKPTRRVAHDVDMQPRMSEFRLPQWPRRRGAPGRFCSGNHTGRAKSRGLIMAMYSRPEIVRWGRDDGDDDADFRTLSSVVFTATENYITAVFVDFERGTRCDHREIQSKIRSRLEKTRQVCDDRRHL